ncbi:NAD-dependent epimerase/dehydratase family protein [Motilibacter aurantiacus]|uniref:NAD-dependent epimerase/dehydratase family protein n=1 Tax=Motilibacter aurantiacus TaxID=2714955 RepID=UPI0014097653|nr:NAD-dependent epimerase/dehydratase family protein [Motilibacter aurantiacus]NHC46358.1 NAD-dependent epimerase/dehydratase family protein [Motilibacter aurantiacus]
MKWVVTGGCGFIGTNVAERLAADGEEVVVVDNLARPRVHRNLSFLRDELGLEVVVADIRDLEAVRSLLRTHSDAGAVLHLAGQVSFVASLRDPRYDFEANTVGTFNVLEAVRDFAPQAVVVYSSTNKVYGDLDELAVEETETRYVLRDYPHGVPSTLPLRLHGGYGCSKGAADQFVVDWAHFHDLRSVSFRQSSVYGGRQFSTEDQGWAAFFAERFSANESYRISGTGKQVRDLLHVDDLYRAFRAAVAAPDAVRGRAVNIGGGPSNSASLLELFDQLAELTGNRPDYERGPGRPADQKVFIADVRELDELLGWRPQIGLDKGLPELVEWAGRVVGGAV